MDCAVIVVQKEFAKKLDAARGNEDYGWLTVQTYLHVDVQLLDAVPKEMFFPEPKVDSVIVCLKTCGERRFEVGDRDFFKRVTKWLFTQRNKKLSKAIAPFLRNDLHLSKKDAEKLAAALPFHDKRPRELAPEQFGELANAITR
jgi:16S rRNA (adenine1518-N6/adenine1519-N6)-dimethyltransferase